MGDPTRQGACPFLPSPHPPQNDHDLRSKDLINHLGKQIRCHHCAQRKPLGQLLESTDPEEGQGSSAMSSNKLSLHPAIVLRLAVLVTNRAVAITGLDDRKLGSRRMMHRSEYSSPCKSGLLGVSQSNGPVPLHRFSPLRETSMCSRLRAQTKRGRRENVDRATRYVSVLGFRVD